MFSKYGWIVTRNHQNLLNHGKKILKLVNESQRHVEGIISGRYIQIDCLRKGNPFCSWGKKFMELLEPQVQRILKEQGVHDAEKGKLIHLKLLRAPPGSPGQSPHRDGLSKNAFVVAFYLTPHSSTYFSTQPYLPNVTFKKLTKEEMHQIPDSYWTDFISVQCQAGDLSVFREDVVHKGPPNESEEERYVLFSVLKLPPEETKHKDYIQYYPWDWYEQRDGFGSESHLRELRRNEVFLPWTHYGSKKRKKMRALCARETKAEKKRKEIK